MSEQHKQAVKRRMEREREQRIQGILEAARRVFVAEGYTRAIMEKIALEAGITKPTIYQYFKTKDELFFALMLPVIDDLHVQIGKIERKLAAGKYASGKQLVHDLIRGAHHSYEVAPESFLMLQFFQQTGLVGKLNEAISSRLDEKGRSNFTVLRRVIREAMSQGLFKKSPVDETTDVLWALFTGVIQLEHIKSPERSPAHLKPTLKVAEQFIINALAENCP
ncbi:MAG: helix-turn-helix transcriptional regulator [Deltaproteobacteria bacterium]|nr:helix-turn-helix transcriptional regulator [Deltaproteobacteria bacterium]